MFHLYLKRVSSFVYFCFLYLRVLLCFHEIYYFFNYIALFKLGEFRILFGTKKVEFEIQILLKSFNIINCIHEIKVDSIVVYLQDQLLTSTVNALYPKLTKAFIFDPVPHEHKTLYLLDEEFTFIS